MRGAATLPSVSERRIYRAPWRIDVTVRAGVPRLVAVVELTRIAAAALDAAATSTPAATPTPAATGHPPASPRTGRSAPRPSG